MGIVFGCITPHPPLLIPEVGRGNETAVTSTVEAMKKLSRELAGTRPETIIVISPHGQAHSESMGIARAAKIRGSMRNWGATIADHDFDNDPVLVAGIEKEATASGVPLESIGDRDYRLDHGVMVPMYFLVGAVKGAPMVPLTFCWLPLDSHFRFGQTIRKAADRTGKRVAVIASGDLSHRLIPDAPAGYDPMGKVFDDRLVKAISSYDIKEILSFDNHLVERAGECGLRSFVILLGALDGLKVRPKVLSYEGPFGVGYLVASLDVETK